MPFLLLALAAGAVFYFASSKPNAVAASLTKKPSLGDVVVVDAKDGKTGAPLGKTTIQITSVGGKITTSAGTANAASGRVLSGSYQGADALLVYP